MFNIVTGLRRSGTSLMMLAIRQSGIPIIGFKYPIEFNNNGTVSCIPSIEARKANPTGYWEAGSITTQIGLTPNYVDMGNDGDVIKVIADALCKSNKVMVGKVIVMIREPKRMLKSLASAGVFKIEELDLVAMTKVQFQVELFKYLKNIEYIVVAYEDLLESPKEEMKRVTDFLGKGNQEGHKAVNPKFNRSKEMSKEFELLENIYKWARQGEFEKITSIY